MRIADDGSAAETRAIPYRQVAKLSEYLRDVDMVGKKDEGRIVAEWAGLAAVSEIQTRMSAVGNQSRRVGDQPREAADAQRRQDRPGNESRPNPPHQPCGLLTPAIGGLGSATAAATR